MVQKKRNRLNEKKKPGGGITKLGAMRVVNPSSWEKEVRTALSAARGDVADAADAADVSTRRFYDYLNDDPSLKKAQEKMQDDAETKEETKKESNLRISLGTLRKIIREELERARQLDEIKLQMNEPMAFGGAGFTTMGKSQLPSLEDLELEYGLEEIPARELLRWLKESGLEATNFPPPGIIPSYKFVDSKLYGLGIEGNQEIVVNASGAGRYSFDRVKLSPDVAAGRIKYSS